MFVTDTRTSSRMETCKLYALLCVQHARKNENTIAIHCRSSMIISKIATTGPVERQEYYWDGTSEPVNLRIGIRFNYGNYDVSSLSLVVINYRLYALTKNWSIMLYDTTVPDDELNIQERVHPYQTCVNSTLIVKYISRCVKKVFYHSNGASILHTYNDGRITRDVITRISGDSVYHAEDDPRYTEYFHNDISDTITHEIWRMRHELPIMDARRCMNITNTSQTIKISMKYHNKYLVGIVDNCVVDYSTENLLTTFTITPIHDMDNERVIITLQNTHNSIIYGYFLYVLTICGYEYDLYIIDVRNGYTYEFTHEYVPA